MLSGRGLVSVEWTMNNSLRLDDRWSWEIGGEYESKRRFVGSEYGSYYLVNLAVRRSLWKGRGSVTLNAHNIFQSEVIWSRDSYPGFRQYMGAVFIRGL
ncbi:outer membrane beta-barrel protein [Puia sp. P3]|uniref:outer membrane beta-barrel protein n=1 Tax=Puia sp. P3 TaxID=3423952 RepID=UPI003D67A13C